MKKLLSLLALLSLGLVNNACSDSDNSSPEKPTKLQVSGRVEKGPFISGSTIRLEPMDSNMQPLGSSYSTLIKDDLGSFDFGIKELENNLAQLTATGYFFNEVEGELSEGQISLRAIVDLSEHATVNVNLLTHLKYPRIMKLTKEGMSYKNANNKAQKELLSAFGLQRYAAKDASLYSIASGTEEAAALIAISSLLINERSEAELTEYLMKLSEEFAENGEFSEESQRQFKRDMYDLDYRLPYISESIIDRYENLGITVDVKDLAYFFDWDGDGIAGNEILDEDEDVELEMTELYVPNAGGEFTIKIKTNIPLTTSNPSFLDDDDDYVIAYPDDGLGFDAPLYESPITPKSLQSKVENGVLKINVDPLESRLDATHYIRLYDYRANVVARLSVIQKGNPNQKLSKLGSYSKSVFAEVINRSNRVYESILEIGDIYNKSANISTSSPVIAEDNRTVSSLWSNLFALNGTTLHLKQADKIRYGIYQEYLDLQTAFYYYTMIQLWGDVPYITSNDRYNTSLPSRTNQYKILDSIEDNLKKAIEYFDEKKNLFTTDLNDYFFVSKDVPRTLLAYIYMYRGEYSKAKVLLDKVISNGFYSLGSDLNYSKGEEIFVLDSSSYSGPNRQLPIIYLTDVYLALAECCFKVDDISQADKVLNELAQAKGLNLSDDCIESIKNIRAKMGVNKLSYFAFLKRNKLAEDELNIEDWQQVLPIPLDELYRNPSITQNKGY